MYKTVNTEPKSTAKNEPLNNRHSLSFHNNEAGIKTKINGHANNLVMQRKCNDCEEDELQMKNTTDPVSQTIQMQPITEKFHSMLRMQPLEEEEEMMQPKVKPGSMAPEIITSQINSTKGNGQPLSAQTNQFMNNAFGTNFNGVQIHTGLKAAKMNEHLGARAFTHGNDIFFNTGEYNPESGRGKSLLAHELTHVIQQGAAISPRIQRDGEGTESTESESGSGSNPLARTLAGLLRDQLSDSSMRGHLSSLGTALQGLAVESTSEGGDQPVASAERLAALGIPGAFENTARAIISSPTFRQLRERIIGIVGSSDEAALITALAAALALILADIPVSGSPSGDIGAGFSAGGSFDFGTIRSLQFRNLSAYAQYANSYFQTRLSGTVSRDQETGDFSGSGTGQIRLGNDLSSLTGRVTVDHEGQITLAGRLASGYSFGGSNRLIFTTDISHSFASDETIIKPGVSGRFSFGTDQSLRLGSELQITTGSGLTGVTGFLEYQQDTVRLRIEGSMTGLGENVGIVPGGDMRVQGVLTIPLW